MNTLAPGAIETDFGGGTVRDNAAVNAMVADNTALGRAGQPDDIGGALALLLSPGAQWINGQRRRGFRRDVSLKSGHKKSQPFGLRFFLFIP